MIERLAAPKLSDRMLMPLPRALYPLYYPARPILLAIKHRERLFGNATSLSLQQRGCAMKCMNS